MVDDPTETKSEKIEPPGDGESIQSEDNVTSSPGSAGNETQDKTGAAERDISLHTAGDAAPHSGGSSTPKKRNIKIGSQRDKQDHNSGSSTKNLQKNKIASFPNVGGDTKISNTPSTSTGPSAPTPTIESVLTPELQQEIDLAIGDTEIDQLLTSSDAVAHAFLNEGDRVQGRVLSVNQESVVVDLDRPHQGILPVKQFEKPPVAGDTVSVLIQNFNSQEGIYDLAIPGATVNVEDWSELAENMTVEVIVTGHNKGGLEVSTSGLRGFIPASQVGLFRVNDLEEFVGKKFSCLVTKVEPTRRNLVLSRRAILERERQEKKEKLLASLQKGQTCKGVVSRIQPFGAFVDLGGVDGLIHISKMSWSRINHPSEVLKEGEAIEVKVDRIDQESGKIGLSYRDTFENPWHSAASRYPVRSRCKGTVTRITEFGAFVRLEAGIEGLLHISEIAHRRIQRASDVLSKDEEIEVQILSVDTDGQRISLSLKAIQSPPAEEAAAIASNEEQAETSATTRKKPSESNLKGGTDRSSGGEQFGLKW